MCLTASRRFSRLIFDIDSNLSRLVKRRRKHASDGPAGYSRRRRSRCSSIVTIFSFTRCIDLATNRYQGKIILRQAVFDLAENRPEEIGDWEARGKERKREIRRRDERVLSLSISRPFNFADVVPTFSLSPNIIIKVNSWPTIRTNTLMPCNRRENETPRDRGRGLIGRDDGEKEKAGAFREGHFSLPALSIGPTRFAIALLKLPAAASRSAMRPRESL